MQFRPVVSAIKKKLYSKTCGYLLIIRHLANKNSTAVKPCYFFQRAICIGNSTVSRAIRN